jgi:AbiV family abortive infection protein
VKAATSPELVAVAAAAAANARDLLGDAWVLAGAGRHARACSLAVLAVEECGKAAYLIALAAIPGNMRAGGPVGRMLEWHQLKLVGGLLIAAVQYEPPGIAPKIAALGQAELARVLSAVGAPVDEADRLKRHGFYVDVAPDGRIQAPSDFSEAQVAGQLALATRAVSSVRVLLDPAEHARFASPPIETVDLSQELVVALIEAEGARTPDAAADVMLTAIRKLRDRKASQEPRAIQEG